MSRRKRILVIAGASFLSLATAAAGTIFVLANQLSGNIARIPNVFKGLPASSRPHVPAADRGSMTILVVGSDSRSAVQPLAADRGTAQYNDAVMLVHISAGGQAVSVISIPRSSWVDVPGHGMASFDTVLPLGGPSLMVRTVEHLTGVRIDHFAVIDLAGLSSLVRVLGGVQVAIARPTTREGITFHKGLNELTPKSAMVYVSTATRPARCHHCWQRNGLPGGDLSRVQRQQNLIRAILAKAASLHLLTDPIAMYRLVDAFSHIVSVDSTFSNSAVRSLALELAQVRGRDFTFLTVPVRGLGWRKHQSVAYLSQAACATLWNAVNQDAVARWAAQHPASQTPEVPY